MNPTVLDSTIAPREVSLGWPAARASVIAHSLLLRALLLVGSALSIGIAAWEGHPAAYLQADPSLARLLQGMALIKGAVVTGGVAAVLWRFGWRVTMPIALTYLVGSWALAGTTMLIWRLTMIPLAAVTFHAALIGLLVAAWRDDNKLGRHTLHANE